MKNKFFALAFMLIGTFAMANIDNSITENKEELGCTSTTTTTTTINSDGSGNSTSTTTTTCDTPQEQAAFIAALTQLMN